MKTELEKLREENEYLRQLETERATCCWVNERLVVKMTRACEEIVDLAHNPDGLGSAEVLERAIEIASEALR